MLDTFVMPELAPKCTMGPPLPRKQSRIRLLAKCLALAGFILLLTECLRIFAGSNFHDVVAGKCYRSAQPTPQFLENAQRLYGIRTIVNLRDENEDEIWYQQEKQASERLNLNLINAGLSSREQAPAVDFRKFVQVMKVAEEPILIHCANGNDRSGLASAIYLLMRTDTSIETARHQLSLRFGHIPWTKASCLNRVLDSYVAWLEHHEWEHNADRFHYWGTEIYQAEPVY